MKQIYYFFLLFIFASCGILRPNKTPEIAGVYSWYGVYGVGAEITLEADSTFTYEWYQGLIGGTTSGKWKQNGNTLILNSDLQPEDAIQSCKVIEVSSTPSEQVRIDIVDQNGMPLPFTYCMLKDDSILTVAGSANVEGQIEFDAQPSDSLLFRYPGGDVVAIPIIAKATYYKVEIRYFDHYYEYFTDEKWLYRRRNLDSEHYEGLPVTFERKK